MSDRPEHAHRTGGIIFDAVKSFIGGGMSFGRSTPESASDGSFQFTIGASYYDEHVEVVLEIPDVEPGALLAFHDVSIRALDRGTLLLKVDGMSMPFSTALAKTAIRLGDAQRQYERRTAIAPAQHEGHGETETGI